MSKVESSAEIGAAAAEWAVLVDGGSLNEDTDVALDLWLAADIRRRGAFARAQAMLLHTRRAKALGPDFDPGAYLAQHGEERTAIDDATDIAELPTRRRFLLWGGSAAAVAASAVLAVGLGWKSEAEAYTTKRGEMRLVPLADGSRMTLNTASEAMVRFTKGERRVELTEGEALFDVAKDAARPFFVTAGDTEVRAVGTSFTVQHLPGKPVRVLVREGVVEIRSTAAKQMEPKRVSANMRAMTSDDAAIETAPVAPSELGRELAWREGMLSFEDQTLEQAAGEFSRYSDVRIRFADASIGQETITGLYAATNPRGFAKSAALSLGLKAQSGPDGILITR